jgi:hypothetical protein
LSTAGCLPAVQDFSRQYDCLGGANTYSLAFGLAEAISKMLNSNKVDKQELPIRVVMAQGDALHGFVYVRQGQRVSDLMMDEKPFFVLRTNAGVVIINKTYVVMVEPLSLETFEARKSHFPASSERR